MQKTLKKYFPVFVLPTLIAFAFAFILPFVMGVYLSFCKFKTITSAQFIGLENYVKIFADKDFLNAFWFTVRFSVLSILTINIFAFVLALALTRKIRGTNLFRTVFFMPNLIGGIILGYIWQQMINAVLLQYETTLVANATYGFWGLIILMNWQMIGYMMIIYIAGLQNVPTDLLEAAQIDGATGGQVFFKITLPLLMPILVYVAITSLIGGLQMFDVPQIMRITSTPTEDTNTMIMWLNSLITGASRQYGMGGAMSVLIFAVTGVLSVIVYKTMVTSPDKAKSKKKSK